MMNIKRMLSCIAVVVAALLLAVSCGNMLEAPKAEGVEGGMGRLSVSMGDGRAVFPEELEFETDKELTFTLSGSLSGGEGKEIRSWKAEGDKTAYQVMVADTSLTVEAGQWSFTLQAKRGGTVVATASKDLEVKGGQENRLSFGTMDYSDEGTGTVTITISWNEVERVTSVVAGLYHRDSGELVDGTEVTFDTIEGAQVTYKQNVPAGIYRLKAQMYQNTDVIGTYSELVRVAGGLSSEAERELGSLNTLYTVTLDFGGQGELSTGSSFPETYNRSQTVTLPTAEQVASNTDAYSFAYWYEKDDTGMTPVTQIPGLDGNKTYCAYWQVAPVTFTLAGDIVTLSTATAGATIQYKLDDGEWMDYTEETPISVTTSTTITAKATKKGLNDSNVAARTYCVVTFDANGGSEVAPQVVESGNAATKPTDPTDPTNGNKVLAGWYTSADGGTTLADTAYSFDAPVAGDITFYAWWLPKPGTVVRNGLTIDDVTLEKTSEVQVLSTAVDLSSLDKDGVDSKVFISSRSGTIHPFVMGQYEVTQQLYEAVMGSNPSYFTSDVAAGETQELRPVEQVSWYDAVVFCNELSNLMELEPVYSKDGTTDTSKWGEVPTSSDAGWNAITCDFTKSGYRLPTEAEWELAARGGNAGAGAWQYTYAGTNEEDELKANYAWYSSNSDSKTHEVGTKTANSLGLYDMSGNVFEWCWDWNGSITKDTPSGGAASGSYRVRHGGSWSNSASNCTVSIRFGDYPRNRRNGLGFRLVRSAK